jgi:hypothetical protein
MKSILYVGAALMIGASIYGFVDYKKSSKQKGFSKMYEPGPETVVTKKEEPKVLPAVVKTDAPAEVKESSPVKEAAKTIKRTKKKRRFQYSEFSRAPLREDVIEIETKN